VRKYGVLSRILQTREAPAIAAIAGSQLRRRYELFCRKLVLERYYTTSAFITSTATDGSRGLFATPADDLSLERFANLLVSHLAAFV